MKEQIIAVQRMQDYIGENLTKEITLSDLARTSLFSPWYSYRLFREHLGLTPAEYIRKLRLSRAALRLRDENCRILDVAFDLGFGNVDTFTRAFFSGVWAESKRLRESLGAHSAVHSLRR